MTRELLSLENFLRFLKGSKDGEGIVLDPVTKTQDEFVGLSRSYILGLLKSLEEAGEIKRIKSGRTITGVKILGIQTKPAEVLGTPLVALKRQPEVKEHKKCLILLDIDNMILKQASRGGNFLEKGDLINAVKYIIGHSKKRSEIVETYAFLTTKTRDLQMLIDSFRRMGVKTVVVPPIKDAADIKMCDKIKSALSSGYDTDFFIIVSEDGKAFNSMCDLIESYRKRVLIIIPCSLNHSCKFKKSAEVLSLFSLIKNNNKRKKLKPFKKAV